MKRVAYILAMALAAPLAASAQQPATLEQGPAQRLLAHRAELSLTAAQVQKLEAIDLRYREQNRDVVARLETLRGGAVGDPVRMRELSLEERQQLQASRAEMQPLMQRLRESHNQQLGELRGVLNQEQNRNANQYLYQGPGQGQGRGVGAAGETMRGQGRGQGSGRGMMRGGGQGGGRGGRGPGGS
jgi:hypothetical protein